MPLTGTHLPPTNHSTNWSPPPPGFPVRCVRHVQWNVPHTWKPDIEELADTSVGSMHVRPVRYHRPNSETFRGEIHRDYGTILEIQ